MFGRPVWTKTLKMYASKVRHMPKQALLHPWEWVDKLVTTACRLHGSDACAC